MRRTTNFLIFLFSVFLVIGAMSARASDPDDRLVKILKKGPVGIEQFNRWRRFNPIEEVNLRGADLRDVDLRGADLRLADLSYSQLRGAVFGVNFAEELARAEKCRKEFESRKSRERGLKAAMDNILKDVASLTECDNSFAILARVQRNAANLRGADLMNAELEGAKFAGAKGCDEVLNAPPDFESRCANPRQ